MFFCKRRSRPDLLNHPVHQWMNSDPFLHKIFRQFFDQLPQKFWDKIEEEKYPLFLLQEGKHAGVVYSKENRPLILIYPDLLRLLRSPYYREGLAVLAHEIGHLLNGHYLMEKSILQQQLEADDFAKLCGFGEDLIAYLKRFYFSEYCFERIKALNENPVIT